ncbi:MAG: shikimate dehydrogenase [Dysgonomonas sp.]|nr:shikimate dehydrogenase [Dysgonomonas sp.]
MDLYGLIGYPLKHSFSQRFFTEKFLTENINAEYSNYEIENIALFPEVIKSNPALRGLNVTLPYKEVIIPYLDELDPQAKDIGAINVIKFIRDKDNLKLVGYNSDIIGFQNSIEPLINKATQKKALILGTGGASKAVLKGLQNLGIECKYVSRTSKADFFTYGDLNKDILEEYQIIVNASPLGTFPDIETYPNIPYQYLSANHLLYDLVYNPSETKFLTLGKEKGATIKNGAEMLQLQAIAAWGIWNK